MNSVAQVAVLAAEQRVVSPLMAIDSAVAECVAEDHEHLTVGGIAVIPRNSEVGPGDAEAFQGLVGAVRSGHPLGEGCGSPGERGTRIRRRRQAGSGAGAGFGVS